MEFGRVDLADAEGAILAHSLALPDGRLRKGVCLGPDDVARLRAAKITRVTVARLGPQDVHEDQAATDLAHALAEGSGLLVDGGATGRVNLRAPEPGIIEVDPLQIHTVNRVDPMLSVATPVPWQRLAARGLAATVKIISYGVPRDVLERAGDAARGALRFYPASLRRAALIETRLDKDPPGGGKRALNARLSRLGAALSWRQTVQHDCDALAEGFAQARAEDVQIIFVLTASATSDVRDVAPMALQQAGGRLIRFGMPVDPGNLLFLGDLRGVPVIGLPGCARSVALNGADWVLERLICGVPVDDRAIAAMGVGGLLKEIPSRPSPRDR